MPSTKSGTRLISAIASATSAGTPNMRRGGNQGAVLHAQSAGQDKGGGAAALTEALDGQAAARLTGWPMKASAIQTSLAPKNTAPR